MNDQRFFLVTRRDGIRTYIRVDAIDRVTLAADKGILVLSDDQIEVTDPSEATVIIVAMGEMSVKSL